MILPLGPYLAGASMRDIDFSPPIARKAPTVVLNKAQNPGGG